MSSLKKYRFSKLYVMSSGISSKPEQAGHGSPFLSFSTVFNNYFLPEVLSNKMDTSEKEQETYSIKDGDIFLTRTSETIDELGMSCVALQDYPKATFSGFVKRLRPIQNDLTYAKYMGFYLRSRFFRKTMTNNAIMTLRASLNEEIFSYLDLFLPNYDTQKKIGDFLFLINSKIAMNQRINRELEAMAKTIYDYWFVQFDFPYDFEAGRPDPAGRPYKSSGGRMVWSEVLKREVPEGWEVKMLGEVAKIKAGGDKPLIFSANKTEFCPIPIFSNGIENEGLYGYTNEATIIDQSITISARGTIGFSVLRNKPFVPIIRLITITPFDFRYSTYLHESIKLLEFERSGSVQRQLTVPQVSSIEVLVPYSDLIGIFEKITTSLISEIEVLKEQTQHLTSLRDWLLPMLMNGQVEVGGE